MKKIFCLSLVVLFVALAAAGCGSDVADENGNGTDNGYVPDEITGVDPPGGFPVYPGAKLTSQRDIAGVGYFTYSTPASIDEIRYYLLKGLREAGYYATAASYSQFVSADEANDIFVVDADGELAAFIIVHRGASEYDVDGYTIQAVENIDDVARLDGDPGADLDVDEPEGLPVYPGAFLADYEDYREQYIGVEHFYYHVPVDLWAGDGENAEFREVFDYYLEEMDGDGWDITDEETSFGRFQLDAERDGREIRVELSEWSTGGVTLGVRVRVTV